MKRKINKCVFCITILLLGFSQSKAQIEPIASGIVVKTAIDQITNGINNVIDKAEQSGDFLMSRAGQELLFTIQAFESVSQDILEDTFDEISHERKAILNKTIEVTNKLVSGVDLSLNRTEDMVDQVNRLVRETTFKSYPVIFRYRGGILIPGENQNIRLTITGHKLIAGNPTIQIGNRKFDAIKNNETLIFEIPRNLFKADDFLFKNEKVTLKVYQQTGMWWWEKHKAVSYDLSILILPQNMGKIKLSYVENKSINKEEIFTKEVSHNHGGSRWSCKGFAPSISNPNRKVDTDRTWAVKRSGNAGGKMQDLKITSAGLSFRICCKRANARSPGFRHVKYQYVEVWQETEKTEKELTKKLKWNEDILLNPGENSEKYILEVSLFNGRKYYSTNSERVGNYLDILYDYDNYVVIIKPNLPTDLKRI